MLWAAYVLPVLLKVLRGLKKGARLDLSVYTKPIKVCATTFKAIACAFIVDKSVAIFAHYCDVKFT